MPSRALQVCSAECQARGRCGRSRSPPDALLVVGAREVEHR
ncbi:MAG: hypothetical protein QOG40_1760, partial [Solirubrobacteraceae bacterium]|nr:hypothetical protein [Solirubrobacteraceae bacterium]